MLPRIFGLAVTVRLARHRAASGEFKLSEEKKMTNGPDELDVSPGCSLSGQILETWPRIDFLRGFSFEGSTPNSNRLAFTVIIDE
jgi:hypothetical protein